MSGGRRQELAENLRHVEERLDRACRAAGRQRAEVTLVAVTKTWPATDAQLLVELGVVDLGENRDAEARAKAAQVTGARWHFVGSVQSNKAGSVARYAHLVHSVDRPSLCQALSRGAVAAGRTVGVLLQVSLDGDPARGGAPIGDLPALADRVAASPGLELRGVMAVAPLGAEPAGAFARLAEAARGLQQAHPGARAISAGMSADLEHAVAAGATHVRVGTAMLGHRPGVLR